jgi:hypothetical protein
MRTRPAIGLGVILAATACGTGPAPQAAGSATLDSARVAAMQDSVRAFANSVSQGVTSRGPAAWRGFFADEPAFFMAANGVLVFPTSDSATRGIEDLTHVFASIQLQWGDGARVDVLAPGIALFAAPYHEVLVDVKGNRIDATGYFTGIAEHRNAVWRFRDAHWSVPLPSPVAR